LRKTGRCEIRSETKMRMKEVKGRDEKTRKKRKMQMMEEVRWIVSNPRQKSLSDLTVPSR